LRKPLVLDKENEKIFINWLTKLWLD
jgi:hypothetical protein